MSHDSAVDDRDSDAGAVVPVLKGDVGVNRGFGKLQSAMDFMIRGYILDLRVIGQLRHFGGGETVRARLHHFEGAPDGATPHQDLRVVGESGRLGERNDDVHLFLCVNPLQLRRQLRVCREADAGGKQADDAGFEYTVSITVKYVKSHMLALDRKSVV